MTADRARIACLDLDTFFVSVERLLDPSLQGRPVIVGGRPGTRGVVTACSYEVRRFGVHSGMSLRRATELAPDAVYLPVRSGAYGDYSARVRQIVERYCPVVRSASIDEFYLDFRGCERLYARTGDRDADATIERIVRELCAAIARDVGLPASVGIATSKPVAKIASGLAKPSGVLLVPAGSEAELLAPLPVQRMPGIGPVAAQRLQRCGIHTLGALAATPARDLHGMLGAYAARLHEAASGRGDSQFGRDRPAFREHDAPGDAVSSISNERTFHHDVGDPRALEASLCGLSERVCWRARLRGVKARTVTLKLRYADFRTLSRSRTVSASDCESEIYPIVRALLRRARTRPMRVRLLGVALSNLVAGDQQLPLFASKARLHESVDGLREKYGFDTLRRAGSDHRTRDR